ncbi:MAG: helix-turn-helix transcriptional regulator [Deltaproteobacteria bacterium]|nr:helix-turn-helix transcriptional regulator [Deltaproteobacteria bacterium]
MEILSTKEIAKYLRINEKKVYALVQEGKIPHLKIGGKIGFPKELIDRWIIEKAQGEKDLLISGSDDPLFRLIIDSFNKENDEAIAFYAPVGSLKGLELLDAKRARMACCHVLDLDTGEYTPSYVKRYLKGSDFIVIELFKRRQGLLLKKGNPLGIKNLRDLATKKASFVNRNRESGTRLLFDFLLKRYKVDPESITGYEREVESHIKAGLFVLKGLVDCSFGIEYVAYLLDLDFVPLFLERFDIVIPREIYLRPVTKSFVSYFEQPQILKIAREYPGYELEGSGRIIFEF